MKTEQLSPHFTAWRPGRTHKAHAWSAEDSQLGQTRIRDIYHYTTRMGTFTHSDLGWDFAPVSVGHGSVSDAQGMNKITARYGWRMYRDQRGGGPRWESDEQHAKKLAAPKPRRVVSSRREPDKLTLKALKRGVTA